MRSHIFLQENVSLIIQTIPYSFYCRFAAGYGLFMFFQGNLMFLLGPIVGWIRDKTQSYVLLVYCLQFFMSLCVIPWIIEIVWLRLKARKNNG